jgi:hypothetical protein
MAQTATTGNLENAQKIMIASARYTEEHNAPMMALTEQFTLKNGEKQVTVPKVGQMTMSDLVDGQDIIDEEEIGMTTVDLTAAEVGAKVVLTDKLVRQSVPNVFQMVGRQLGDGMARKKDTDVQALYTNLNDGTLLGLASKELSAVNLTGCIAFAKANKFGNKLYTVHHPNAVAEFVKSAAVSPSINYPVPRGWSEDLGTLTSVKMRTERERDASLRGTEVVITADYGVFELDNDRGAGLLYDITAPVTSS